MLQEPPYADAFSDKPDNEALLSECLNCSEMPSDLLGEDLHSPQIQISKLYPEGIGR